MQNILIVQSSLNGDQSQSNQLANQLASVFKQQGNHTTTIRDLVTSPLPHLSKDEMLAWMTPSQDRTPEQAELAVLSEQLIAELKQSDTLIVPMPLYNFSVPSTFKAWIDRVARAGITFQYTENGPQGLLTNKKVYVIATRGGMYQGTEKDSQTQYLNDVFSFLGMDNIEFIYAEGLNMQGGEKRLEAATDSINALSLA